MHSPHFQTERLTFLRNVCIHLPERETAPHCNAPVEHVGGFSLPPIPPLSSSHAAHGQCDGSLFSNGFEFVTVDAAAATALVYIFTRSTHCES